MNLPKTHAATTSASAAAAARSRCVSGDADTIWGSFLVDAHVHCHVGFDSTAFLSGARDNFTGAATRLGRTPATGWLLLAELPRDRWFDALRAGEVGAAGWRVEATDEAESLILAPPEGPTLIVVAGRQIVTREGLEVLALATAAEFRDGEDLATTVGAVRATGALPVLPWGFGKWWGRRGAAVTRFLETAERPLFLGDNGGRPARFPTPGAFAVAAKRGILVLPGSDPLPLAAEVGKAGRYGFVVEGTVERARPAAGLRRLLGRLQRQPSSFGRLETGATFVARQLALRLPRKPGPGPGGAG